MYRGHVIAVVIPVLNEEASIGHVLDAIPEWVDDIVVADNGSVDGTAQSAMEHGARVVAEPERGYGAACLAGIAALDAPDIVVFLDGDYSDHPEEMPRLLDPIIDDRAALVIGSRVLGEHEPGALTPQAAFGNWLATRLIRFFWGVEHTDLGPFRAIRTDALARVGMRDRDYGWTVEMQIKAALHGLPAVEVPVSYRKRIGVSKVSGTVRGVIGAGYKILGWIFACVLFTTPKVHDTVLVVFTRWPEAGKTKTRMIPALGAEGAAELQWQMTEHVLDCVPEPGAMDVEVRFEGGDAQRMRRWLGARHRYTSQGDGDLGDRMMRALSANARRGYEKVIIVGADCPEADSRTAHMAQFVLGHDNFILCPAHDGGFYLIGLNASAIHRDVDALFSGVEWGGTDVLTQTVRNMKALALEGPLLLPGNDIDLPEDLPHWERARTAQQLAIIVPALNEGAYIGATLARLKEATNAEIAVVDGGSTDDTVAIAEAAGARVLHSAPGRARQMNAGARATDAPLLLFVHADTILPEGFAGEVRGILPMRHTALGAFRLAIDHPRVVYRLIEWAANLRSTWRKMPYGDQAIFMRRDIFEVLGGFPEQPALEDIDFVRRARRLRAITIAPSVATTSARRWEKRGPLRTTLFNIFVYVAAPLGLSRAWVARRNHAL